MTTSEDSCQASKRQHYLAIGLLIAWCLVTRVPYVTDFVAMHKDGPLYVHSLSLDRSYNVPPPGMLGYVLLGKTANYFIDNPAFAFACVTILISTIGVVMIYLLGCRFFSVPIAFTAAIALASNCIFWRFSTPIASYATWLMVLPAIAYFGLKFGNTQRQRDFVLSTLALGMGSIIRPDLLLFGGPLWAYCAILGRARFRQWILGLVILGSCTILWVGMMSYILGGVDVYLSQVAAKNEFFDAQSPSQAGLVEGLIRNGAKYGLFLVWSTHIALPLFCLGLVHHLIKIRQTWRTLILALLWVGPSWYFSFFKFTGSPTLIFPFLPLLYYGAAVGLQWIGGKRSETVAPVGMSLVALASVVQFTLLPLREQRNQRDVIFNVTFLRYSGAAIRAEYNYNLSDFGVNASLKSVLAQIRNPGPIPISDPVAGKENGSSGEDE